MTKQKRKLRLFEGYGVELEYMIVDRKTLDIMPVSDEVIKAAKGSYDNEYASDNMGWSNEFVLHVLEMQNREPVASLSGIEADYDAQIAKINGILAPMGGILMPTSMHPWMRPEKEARLWRRKNRKIYDTYDRIFGCKTHGWANIQSMQINLPFASEEEFHLLHSAVRLALPLIPALAASSPVFDGTLNGVMDNRLFHYMKNQQKVPSVAGHIIPERIFSEEEYHRLILGRMYHDMAEHDPGHVLKHEWLNSRGAIPRFDRDAIEVRLADIQECPKADVAVAAALAGLTKALVDEIWEDIDFQDTWDEYHLLEILTLVAREAEEAVITDRNYLLAFGITERKVTAGEIWRHVLKYADVVDEEQRNVLTEILDHGTLARRIARAVGGGPDQKRLHSVYRELCSCLAKDSLFIE